MPTRLPGAPRNTLPERASRYLQPQRGAVELLAQRFAT
jgi:hypothetical protein